MAKRPGMTQVSIYLPDDLVEELTLRAKRRYKTVSSRRQFIEDALRRYLEIEENLPR
jgi:metal-responsive CopG/Arc/MetJ family transcriptional regulator